MHVMQNNISILDTNKAYCMAKMHFQKSKKSPEKPGDLN